jgi:hypothetical protein
MVLYVSLVDGSIRVVKNKIDFFGRVAYIILEHGSKQ